MTRAGTTRIVSVWWAVAGATAALLAWPDVNTDAQLLVGVASVLGPAAAFAAFRFAGQGRLRVAGGLLILSAVVTPTFMAWALNVPALLLGLFLVVAPNDSPAAATTSR